MHPGLAALLLGATALASSSCGGPRMVDEREEPNPVTFSIESRAGFEGDLFSATGLALCALISIWAGGDLGCGEADPGFEYSSWDGRATLGVRGFDLVVGGSSHRIGDDDVQEYELGLRMRRPTDPSLMPYLEALFRRGVDFETSAGEVDYDGMRLGAGVLGQLRGNWYLDIGVGWDWTFDRLELEAGKPREHVNEFVASVGLAYLF